MTSADDAKARMAEALALAKSQIPADHDRLLADLSQAEFLGQLDSDDDYSGPPTQLRLARVMKYLMDNPSPEAKRVLVSLTQADAFVSFEPRQELLIRALAEVRPAPTLAVDFWRVHSDPDAPFLHVTIAALCQNGSPNALALLAQILADPAYEDEDKIAWMRDPMLRHRNDPPMLETCLALLRAGLPDPLRPFLVEALFDYQANWYLSCNPPHAPPRLEMSELARRALRAIGRYALASVPLGPEIQRAVETGLDQIGPE